MQTEYAASNSASFGIGTIDNAPRAEKLETSSIRETPYRSLSRRRGDDRGHNRASYGVSANSATLVVVSTKLLRECRTKYAKDELKRTQMASRAGISNSMCRLRFLRRWAFGPFDERRKQINWDRQNGCGLMLARNFLYRL